MSNHLNYLTKTTCYIWWIFLFSFNLLYAGMPAPPEEDFPKLEEIRVGDSLVFFHSKSYQDWTPRYLFEYHKSNDSLFFYPVGKSFRSPKAYLQARKSEGNSPKNFHIKDDYAYRDTVNITYDSFEGNYKAILNRKKIKLLNITKAEIDSLKKYSRRNTLLVLLGILVMILR